MRREWELEDLIECGTLDEAEIDLLANKSGATRLGFALSGGRITEEGTHDELLAAGSANSLMSHHF
ncbi:hypothetical protein [Nonomuraea rubra]|uniref:Uncharacterized protein n=1 Tax=Nonomuraea rubra TaxID=46180 RepID=A0A7X0NW95_9ACTN|nr:hypothetical protein [Nonomuraea rubra]MBB6550827.1 hypothetical protein [Nonomuraea rubra]